MEGNSMRIPAIQPEQQQQWDTEVRRDEPSRAVKGLIVACGIEFGLLLVGATLIVGALIAGGVL